VNISAAVAADLAALTAGLGDPDVDLERQLHHLGANLTRAVASFCGLTMTIRLEGHDISLRAGDGIDAKASLHIPLSPLGAAQDGSALVVYAKVSGAFVDLAADLSYALGIDLALLVLDGHLPVDVETSGSGLAGLDEFSRINQAIGVLIGRGHSPDGALDELRRLADLDGGHLVSGADTVLGSLTAPEDDGKPDDVRERDHPR
jgi:hypothetical protein